MGRFLLCALAVLALGGVVAEASVEVVFQDGVVITGESISHSNGLYRLDQGSRGILTIPAKLVREFRYRGEATDIRQVGKELGVRYVLEGSVRKSGNQVRVSCQLVESENGITLWAERLDRSQEVLVHDHDEIGLGGGSEDL